MHSFSSSKNSWSPLISISLASERSRSSKRFFGYDVVLSCFCGVNKRLTIGNENEESSIYIVHNESLSLLQRTVTVEVFSLFQSPFDSPFLSLWTLFDRLNLKRACQRHHAESSSKKILLASVSRQSGTDTQQESKETCPPCPRVRISWREVSCPGNGLLASFYHWIFEIRWTNFHSVRTERDKY